MPIERARLKISDYNELRKSKLQSQERRVRMVSLSLTSMVDMFAILVIFLLASSGTVTDWVKLDHNIKLPAAHSSDIPEKAASVQIAADMIYGDSQTIMPTSEVFKNVEPFRKWLGALDKKDGYINIVAHDQLPFGIIKRVIAACQESGFHNVNLAVQPKMAKN